MLIQIVTCMTPRHFEYGKLLKKSGELLKSGIHNIQWDYVLSCDQDIHEEIGFNCIGKCSTHIHPSFSHSQAIHESYKCLYGDIVVFMDADVILLKKNWDVDIVNETELNDVFGACYTSNLKRYQNIPTIYFLAFRDKKWIQDVSFTPSLKDNDIKVAFFIPDSDIYGSIEKIRCDTGWKLPLHLVNKKYKIIENKLLSERDDMQDCCIEETKILAKKEHSMEEWYYNNELFASHKFNSRRKGLDFGRPKMWKNKCLKYLTDKYNLEI